MRVSDKLLQRSPGQKTVSFEYFGPKTVQGVQNLCERIDRMYKLNPLFIDITWNPGGVQTGPGVTEELIATSQSVIGVDTCMHLTCAGMSTEAIDDALQKAYESGCQTILALRGDPPRVLNEEDVETEPEPTEFNHAIDLVRYIREKYGDHFAIGVAAYPEGHPEEPDADVLIKHLRSKVDAGASFAVTQMFYDADIFIDWVQRCRTAGIHIPILPGIMPISGWASFLRRAKWCQIRIPPEFLAQLEPLSHDDAAVRELGCELVAEMCARIMAEADISHLHFYTMNLEKATVMTLEKLHLIPKPDELRNEPLPWRQSLGLGRKKEGVRPIFWRNRKFSYISRTSDWDEFPNGRWGDSRSPAFGEVETYGSLLRLSPQRARESWGNPSKPADIAALIQQYIVGDLGSLPWSDDPIGAEIAPIRSELVALNASGYLSINSQPAINGARSSDPVHGWGPANGYVYQKAYLELLVPPGLFKQRLLPHLQTLSHDDIAYYAVTANCTGDEVITNASEDEINAVTWGIFPGQEVVQPTIVERTSFLAWKDEAFRLTEEWARCYERDTAPRKLLHLVATTWYLVTIVHHDFQDPKGVFNVIAPATTLH